MEKLALVCHILPPSGIDWRLFWVASQGNIYFTELAERVEQGNFVAVGVQGGEVVRPARAERKRDGLCAWQVSLPRMVSFK